MKRNIFVGAGFLAVSLALGVGYVVMAKRAEVEAAAVEAEVFVPVTDFALEPAGRLEPGERLSVKRIPLGQSWRIRLEPWVELDQIGGGRRGFSFGHRSCHLVGRITPAPSLR